MDDQIFQAMLGTSMPADGSGGSSAMANELRGQRDFGQLLSIAPGMEQAGANMQKGALTQAKQIGDRRQQGLTRTRQAERDKITDDRYNTEEERKDAALKLDADKLKYEREGWTDVETYKDADGNIATYGLKDGRGPLVKIPDSSSLTPYNKPTGYSSSVFRKMTIPGVPDAGFRINDTGQIQGPYGRMFDDYYAFAKEHPDLASDALEKSAARTKSDARAGELGKGIGEEVTELRTGVTNTNASYGASEANMRGIINAIDQGANPGQIYAMAPTITNATSLLESIVSQESLSLLNTYQLKPVSDADMAILRQVASPTMDGPALRAWAENKIAVLQRAQASGRVFEEWVNTNEEVPRGKKRDELQKAMFAAADAAAADPGLPGISGDSSDRPVDVTQKEWDSFSAEDKALLRE